VCVQSKSAEPSWADEFIKQHDQEEYVQPDADFWTKLQHEWEDAAREKAHPWLGDYENFNTDTYQNKVR
jgi:hypothetical protein